MPDDIDGCINNHLYNYLAHSVILNLVKQSFNKISIEGDLYKYRNKVLYMMLDDTATTPNGNPAD